MDVLSVAWAADQDMPFITATAQRFLRTCQVWSEEHDIRVSQATTVKEILKWVDAKKGRGRTLVIHAAGHATPSG